MIWDSAASPAVNEERVSARFSDFARTGADAGMRFGLATGARLTGGRTAGEAVGVAAGDGRTGDAATRRVGDFNRDVPGAATGLGGAPSG